MWREVASVRAPLAQRYEHPLQGQTGKKWLFVVNVRSVNSGLADFFTRSIRMGNRSLKPGCLVIGSAQVKTADGWGSKQPGRLRR